MELSWSSLPFDELEDPFLASSAAYWEGVDEGPFEELDDSFPIPSAPKSTFCKRSSSHFFTFLKSEKKPLDSWFSLPFEELEDPLPATSLP